MDYKKRYNEWLASDKVDEKTKEELLTMNKELNKIKKPKKKN